ncbi:MAG: peptidylprolyl isomerase [Planctomycetota bacterium]|jgi:peptidyl-prolyl cis-trans isomerase A (cyclophilin A)
MRTTSALVFLTCLAGLLHGEDVQIKAAKGVAVADLITQFNRATGQPVLYPAEALRKKTVPARIDVSLPTANVHDFLVFALSTCRLEARLYPSGSDAIRPLAVVLPESSLVTEFRLSGLNLPLAFDRGPGSWRKQADLPGSLTEKTVRALQDQLQEGEPADRARAARLLGYLGPRTPAVAEALAGALQEDGVAPSAAWALSRYGHVARPAIPGLKQAIQRWGARHADALQRAVREIERSLHPSLLDPSRARETAPERFTVRLETTRGPIDIEVTRAWSPLGADRFWNLVKIGFYDGAAFYRVIKGFVAQFGKHSDPRVNQVWSPKKIRGEPPQEPNDYGYVTFAKTNDPHSRSTEVFINLKNNDHLDQPEAGFAPFGRVVKGMKAAEKLYGGYGERPQAGRIHYEGDKYLRDNFPELDYIRRAVLVEIQPGNEK